MGSGVALTTVTGGVNVWSSPAGNDSWGTAQDGTTGVGSSGGGDCGEVGGGDSTPSASVASFSKGMGDLSLMMEYGVAGVREKVGSPSSCEGTVRFSRIISEGRR